MNRTSKFDKEATQIWQKISAGDRVTLPPGFFCQNPLTFTYLRGILFPR